MNPPTFQDVLAAAEIIRPHLPPTPLHRYPGIDQLLDAEVWIKHENYQPTGAFKVRGGVHYVSRLDEAERRRGIVSASTGNHGQSLAYASRLFGGRAILFAPLGANPVKVDAMQGYGAEVILEGDDFEASKRAGEKYARELGLRFVSSGDEPWLIAGVATSTLEILQAQPNIEVLLVPLGGGSGAAGACLTAKAMNPNVRVIAVAAKAAPAGFLTWQAREWRTAPIGTVAAGLATGEPFLMPQQICWQYLDGFELVEDEDLFRAMRWHLEKGKTLSEPAGAATLAAAWNLRETLRGKRVALVLSGGNASPDELRRALGPPAA